MWELYVRKPEATHFALFQDDIVIYRNLRQYLEQCEGNWDRAEKGYLNLFTFPVNHALCPKEGKYTGWFLSNQMGKGALALVFSREGLFALLSSDHLVRKPQGASGYKSLDGAVVTAMKKAKWKEFVHCPSLVQHTGRECSTIGRSKHPLAPVWRGEDFDALELLECQT
jgi:hypothetical protein